ncbi:MAG: fused MFS/spermidine synthase [bacterium]
MTKKNTADNATNKIFFFVLVCFFLSGLTGLIYEILWTRMIIKIIGGAPFAVSIVLTIFMGGMGLGSYLAGRFIDRIKEPLSLVKLFGALELAIGAYALLIPLLLIAFEPLQAVLYNGFFSHFIIYHLLTFMVCTVILCIPVICMGATLPILCRFYVDRLSHLGTHAGRLYGLNTIGAAFGSLLCGFWLINLWGVVGTLVFAVLVNVMIGISCLMVGYKAKVQYAGAAQKTSDRMKTPPKNETENKPSSHTIEGKSALVIFAVSGFCAMACEVIWTRLLGLIVGPTTYSFTIVLVTFITGLALGSMIFGYYADKVKNCMHLLLFTQIAAAILILAVSQLLGGSQMFFSKLIFTFKDQFALLSLSKAVILFIFMILPTLCFGATFPLVGKIYTQSVSEVGYAIGFAYMLNTVGSLLGPFCAGFLLIPLAGKELSLGMIAFLQLGTSLVIAGVLLKNKREGIRQFALIAVPALAGLILCFYYPSWNHQQFSKGRYHRFDQIMEDIASTGWVKTFFQGSRVPSSTEQGELVYYGDGIGGFTTVARYTDAFGNPQYTMANSGKPDASTHGDMHTQTLSAHFPMLFHKDPKAVMVVGLASGITAGEVLYYPVEKLDILEISDQVVAASHFFTPWNNGVLSNPKTDLIIQDGRAHLQLTRQNYDVIISEPSNPWMAGLAALFTGDFFSLAKDRLNDDGIFVQWMHSYQMDWETFALVGRTFAGAFPNSLLVHTDPFLDEGDFLLIGFKGKNRLNLEYADQKFVHVQKSPNVDLADPRLLYRLIVSEDLQQLFGRGVMNTDNRPWLEFAAPKLMYGYDPQLSEKMKSQRWQGFTPETRNIIQQVEADVDSRIDFAALALSLLTPYSDMVDLSNITPPQKERFFKLMERYCANNEVDYSVFNDDELKQRCLSVQIDAIREKIDRLPDRSASLSYLADLYNIKGSTSDAIDCYKEVLRMDPYSAAMHNNLGIALTKEGRFDEAISRFSEGLRIDPLYMKSHYNLGLVLSYEGRLDEAITHFSKALRLNPGYAGAHHDMGVALARKGRVGEAINHFYAALRINPEYAEAHNNIGIALAQEGELAKAIVHFREALQINPDLVDAQSNLQRALALQMN